MFRAILKGTSAAVFGAAVLAQTGCSCGHSKMASGGCTDCPKTKTVAVRHVEPCDRPANELAAELPRNAKPGECWAKVFMPPTFKTVSERVMVKEASEKIEVIPAKYEWVDERVCVKDATTELNVIPAEYAVREKTVLVKPAHTDWEVNKNEDCVDKTIGPAKDIFCLVRHEPDEKVIRQECQVRPAQVREVTVPAQYETVRRHKLVAAAQTKKVCIPAEFDTVERQVKVCDGHMAWQRVDCERRDEVTLNTARVNTPR